MDDADAEARAQRERLEAAGFSVHGRDLPMARLLALGDTTAKAAEVARRGAQWIVDSYFGATHRPVGVTDPAAPGTDPVTRYLDEVILHGTPDAVLDQILRLRGKGIKGLRASYPGDLLCEVVVETPVRLTERHRELLRELEEINRKDASRHNPRAKSFMEKVREFFAG